MIVDVKPVSRLVLQPFWYQAKSNVMTQTIIKAFFARC